MTSSFNLDSTEDITHTEAFQSVDAMVSAYDAEGEGPLRKGEAAFNWAMVEELCLPLAEKTADLRVGIWLIRAALASLEISKVLQSLERISKWVSLSADQLHPLSIESEDNIHALILGWLSSPAFMYGLEKLPVHTKSELTLAAIESYELSQLPMQQEEKTELAQQLNQLLAAIDSIEKHIFDGYSVEGRSLIRVSQLLERCLQKVGQQESGAVEKNTFEDSSPPDKTSGKLNNRNDVKNMLTQMIAYFQANEPSHPAPIFLNRVQRMLGANFEELLDELYPDAQQLIAKIERPKAT
jgi:type VI secretion system protein ImpA